MSDTTPFTSDRIFPFCPDSSVPDQYDYVGGLTLAQVTKIWWMLEDVFISSSGTYADMTMTYADINASGDFPSGGFGSGSGDYSLGYIEPQKRACCASRSALSFAYNGLDGEGNNLSVNIDIQIGIDPDDEDAFAIFYLFNSSSASVFDNGCLIRNPSLFPLDGTPEFSGSVDLGDGILLPWIGGAFLQLGPDGTWTNGGTGFSFSITPTFFTVVP